MQEHRAAAVGYAGLGVVIDLDDEIIEMIVAPEPVAALPGLEPHWLVVMAIAGIFAPGVVGPDGANRQMGARSGVAVGPPPHLPGPKNAARSAAVALALVGQDAAASQRHRNGLSASRQPAAARIAGGGANQDRGNRPITRICLISD
jgi:hypothetical protein